jgi:hypothetical protein
MIGQGLQQAATSGLQAYNQSRDRALAEERLAMEQAQRAEQSQLTQQQIRRGATELANLPEQYKQEAEQRALNIESSRAANEKQQLELAATQKMEEFYNSDAGQMPEGRPGETIRQYQLRMENEGKIANINVSKQALARSIAETDHFKRIAPLEQKQALASLENTYEQQKLAKVQRQSQVIANRQSQESYNVNNLAGYLSRFVNDPKAFNAAADELVQQRGALPGEVGQAMEMALGKMQGREMQQAVIAQSKPEYQLKVDAVRRKATYDRAMSVMQEQAKLLDGPVSLSSAQEEQAISSIADAFSSLGMNELAAKVKSSWTMKGMSPISRKTLVQDSIRNLQKQFDAEMDSDMNKWSDIPGAWDTRRNFFEANYNNQLRGGGQQQQNPFSSLGTVDFSNLGGAK